MGKGDHSQIVKVYFIGDQESLNEGIFVKIGKSADPLGRLATLQTGNPKRLQLLCTTPETNLKSNPVIELNEAYYHEKFQEERVDPSLEWFKWSPRLERAIWWLRAFGSVGISHRVELKVFEDAIEGNIPQLTQAHIYINYLKAKAGEIIKTHLAWNIKNEMKNG